MRIAQRSQKRTNVIDMSGSTFAAQLNASTKTFVNFLNQEAGDCVQATVASIWSAAFG
jgi:hypothetical protein